MNDIVRIVFGFAGAIAILATCATIAKRTGDKIESGWYRLWWLFGIVLSLFMLPLMFWESIDFFKETAEKIAAFRYWPSVGYGILYLPAGFGTTFASFFGTVDYRSGYESLFTVLNSLMGAVPIMLFVLLIGDMRFKIIGLGFVLMVALFFLFPNPYPSYLYSEGVVIEKSDTLTLSIIDYIRVDSTMITLGVSSNKIQDGIVKLRRPKETLLYTKLKKYEWNTDFKKYHEGTYKVDMPDSYGGTIKEDSHKRVAEKIGQVLMSICGIGILVLLLTRKGKEEKQEKKGSNEEST